jgi:VWFA-related protein
MRRIIYLFILALAIAAQCAFAQDGPSKPRTVYVTVESTKTDFVTGLNAGQFKVFENKHEQKISSFGAGAGPMSIGILFDVSESVLQGFRKDTADAAAAISEGVRAQTGRNDYFLIGFNKRVTLLADWTKDPEAISKGLKNRDDIRGKGRGASTALYDAFFEAIVKLNASGNEKKVLIAFSDGVDNSSEHKAQEIIDLARDSNIQVYSLTTREAITPGDFRPNFGTAPMLRIWQFLGDITAATGGAAHEIPSAAPGNLDKELKKGADAGFPGKIGKIFEALSSQYTLVYTPVGPAAGDKLRKVDVKLVLTPEMRESKGSISLKFREKFKPGK